MDELYVLIVSFCNVIETFFQPFYPSEVTYDLHSDMMVLTQQLLFKKQEDGKIYECLAILMRVDSQLDDKNMREKMRLMKAFSPRDFGVEREFCCIVEPPPYIKTIKEEVKEEDGNNDEGTTAEVQNLALPGAIIEANEQSF